MTTTINTPSPRTPKLCIHKPTGQGYVRLNGRSLYLGPYRKPQTREKYHRVISEWLAGGGQLPVNPQEITVEEVCARYWAHCLQYYRKPTGESTSELNNVKLALKPLRESYGLSLAVEFGPKALRAVRRVWIDGKLCRRDVNRFTDHIRRLFKWAVGHELLPVAVHQALTCVEGLRAGRCEARESEPVLPVLEAHIKAVRPFLSRQVRALVDLQLLTGARSGELLNLRPVDFDVSGEVWTVSLQNHKTRHKGKERVLYFGPKAQAIVREFMQDRPVTACLFNPQEAECERRADTPGHRRPGQPETPRKTERRIGEHYDTDSYRRAVARACEKAGITPAWNPHRLRHNAATAIRRQFGLEAAQVLLGHSQASVTEIYALADRDKAVAVIAQIG